MEVKIQSNKLNALYEKGKTLFWKHGVRRISIEEICKEAKVSKMTFYKQFKNREEFAQYILGFVLEEAMEQYRKIMQKDIPYSEKVKELILLKHDSTTLISQEFIEDIYKNEEFGLKQQLEQHQQNFMGEIMRDLAEAQEQGHIRKGLNLDFVLYFLNDMSGKLFDERLAALYPSTQDLIMEITNFFFYGIVGKEKSQE
ncbi:MAG TPA: TetR/AcrR family transcriptional regulator [Prolixibacteraceae bacterium]|nr:TetR/AcrR family transcriptional regulator [Prolixibacteraceae bacterium]